MLPVTFQSPFGVQREPFENEREAGVLLTNPRKLIFRAIFFSTGSLADKA